MQINIKQIAISVVFSSVISVGVVLSLLPQGPKEVVSFDMQGTLQKFVIETAKTGLKGEELDNYVDDYTKRLKDITVKLAAQENILIVAKGAVVSGDLDVTPQIKQLLKQGYGESANVK